MNKDIVEFLKNHYHETFIPFFTVQELANKFQTSTKEVEIVALSMDITPLRYKRNQKTITSEEQLKLLNSHVAIIGCGGLGGHVAESLARVGIGELSLFDFDLFEEHNLNRQNFSNYSVLGQKKVSVISIECQKIHPSLTVHEYDLKFDVQQDFEKIKKANVIVDALDNPSLKLQLAYTCKEEEIAFIHAAIGGLNTQHLSCSTLENLYRDDSLGAEKSLGNPSFTVSYAASLQSAEVVKIVLGLGETLKDRILLSNLLENEFILLEN